MAGFSPAVKAFVPLPAKALKPPPPPNAEVVPPDGCGALLKEVGLFAKAPNPLPVVEVAGVGVDVKPL